MRVIKSFAVSLALMLACLTVAFAQNQREVSGKVLDASQQPLVGVAVLVDGTSNGTMTTENGTFSLKVPAGNVTLEVSSLGYTTKKVSVPSTQASVTIVLEEDNMMLDETVVVG